MIRPNLAQVPPFYHKYINLVTGDNLYTLLQENKEATKDFLTSIEDNKWDFRYAEGKWSIKELVQHITDSERIFSYRALCIARGEIASLPGFDENLYAAASNAGHRSKQQLITEINVVQDATRLLFQSFTDDQLDRSGIANNNSITVRGIGFIILGHLLHHKNILQERYF
jgi:uncharacterized damage-inducible protein DinB